MSVTFVGGAEAYGDGYIAYPTGIQAGDLGIMIRGLDFASTSTSSPQTTGWTELLPWTVASTMSAKVWYKYFTSNETGHTGDTGNIGISFFRGADPAVAPTVGTPWVRSVSNVDLYLANHTVSAGWYRLGLGADRTINSGGIEPDSVVSQTYGTVLYKTIGNPANNATSRIVTSYWLDMTDGFGENKLTMADSSGNALGMQIAIPVLNGDVLVAPNLVSKAASMSDQVYSPAVTVPVETSFGDLLVLFVTASEAGAGSGPNGVGDWVLKSETFSGPLVVRVYTKTANGSEAGKSVSMTWPVACRTDLTVLVYRGAGGAGVEVIKSAVDLSTASHTSPVAMVPGKSRVALTFWADRSSTTTAWAAPSGPTILSTQAGGGGGHISTLITTQVPGEDHYGGLLATANSVSARGVMLTLLLEPSLAVARPFPHVTVWNGTAEKVLSEKPRLAGAPVEGGAVSYLGGAEGYDGSTITFPTIKAGDLGIMTIGADYAIFEPGWVGGWTELLPWTYATNMRVRVYYKYFAAAETQLVCGTGTTGITFWRGADAAVAPTVGAPWIRSASNYKITLANHTIPAGWFRLGLGADRTINANGVEPDQVLNKTYGDVLYTTVGNPAVGTFNSIATSYWLDLSTGSGDCELTMADAAENALGVQIAIPVATGSGISEIRVLPYGSPSVAAMLAKPEFVVAHRGGSLNWPEMSLHAYTQSADRGVDALEVSVAKSSDGVWFGLHDQTLDRTSGISGANASSMTWAEIQTYTIKAEGTTDSSQPRRPYMRLEDLLKAYGDSHVIFLDPKYVMGSADELLSLALSYVPAQRLVGKYYYTATSWANKCTALGIASWGYLYASDMSSFETYQGAWSMLGMEYTAPQSVFDTLLAKGKPVLAHICNNSAAIAAGRAKGANGLMVSGVLSLARVPVPSIIP